MAGKFKPSDNILISSKKELTKVRFLSDLDHQVQYGYGAWKNAFDETNGGLYMGGHDLKVEFLTSVNIYGISNGESYDSFNSNCNIYNEDRVSLNDDYKVYNNYLGATWKLMFKNVPKGTYIIGTDLAWDNRNSLISELFFEYVPSKCLIKKDNKIYSISNDNYNISTKNYNEITIEEDKTIADVFNEKSFTIDDLFNEVTIEDETFKPIDKFNNFKLISDSDVTYTMNGVKSNKELVVASSPISIEMAENIDNVTIDSLISKESSIKMVISKDEEKTWYTFKDGSWSLLDIVIPLKELSDMTEDELSKWNTAKESIFIDGIDSTILNTIDFNKLNADMIQFAYVEYLNEYQSTCKTTQLSMQFDAKGTFKKMKDSEYELDVYESGIVVTPSINTDIMKVNVGYLNFDNHQGDSEPNIEEATNEDIDNILGGNW